MPGVEEHHAGWSRNTTTSDAVGARSNGDSCDHWTALIPRLRAIVGHGSLPPSPSRELDYDPGAGDPGARDIRVAA